MILRQRIRSADKILSRFKSGERLVLGVDDLGRFDEIMAKLGFKVPLVAGQSVLVASHWSKAAEINSEGWVEVHKDEPMETAHRQVIWHWRMKRGWDYEDAHRLVDVPYQRYPRTQHPPLGLELAVQQRDDGSMILCFEPFEAKKSNDFAIKNSVNLLIDVFGECSVFDADRQHLLPGKIVRLNWTILPEGDQLWQALSKAVDHVTARKSSKEKEVITYRFDVIKNLKPDFAATGEHGFAGYVIFGFSQWNLYLLESLFFGNATYALGQDWKSLSKLSKAQLIQNDLHEFRVIHSASWQDDLGIELARYGRIAKRK